MQHCEPWLDCDAIEEQIQLTQKDVGNGLGKMFSKAEFDGQQVAFIRTREDKLTSGKNLASLKSDTKAERDTHSLVGLKY